MRDINGMCDFVRETAFAIHRYHRHGHLEKVYENALAHRLRKAGLDVQQQYPLKVLDEDGTPIGEYFADLIIEDTLITRGLNSFPFYASFAPFCGYLDFPDGHPFAANNLRATCWQAATEAGVSSLRVNEFPTPRAVAPAPKKSGAL